MTLEGFAEDLKQELYRRMEEQKTHSGKPCRRMEYRVLQKNNGVRRHGILVMEEEARVVPYIYIERYLEEYEGGRQLQDIAAEIEQTWGQQLEEKEQELDLSYETVKEQLVYRLVHYEKNKEWLEQVPYLPFLDLAVTFHVMVFQDERATGSVPVRNDHLNKWEVGLKDLCHLALENTPKLFPVEVRRLEDLLEIDPIGIPMYLISNTASIHGAAAILYPSVLSKLSEQLGSSLYLLPSSIHEFIAIPFSQEYKPEELREVVQEVNESQVPEEEFLSNEVYYYDRERAVMAKMEDSSFLSVEKVLY